MMHLFKIVKNSGTKVFRLELVAATISCFKIPTPHLIL